MLKRKPLKILLSLVLVCALSIPLGLTSFAAYYRNNNSNYYLNIHGDYGPYQGCFVSTWAQKGTDQNWVYNSYGGKTVLRPVRNQNYAINRHYDGMHVILWTLYDGLYDSALTYSGSRFKLTHYGTFLEGWAAPGAVCNWTPYQTPNTVWYSTY